MNQLPRLFLFVVVTTTIITVSYPVIVGRINNNSMKEASSFEILMDDRQPFRVSVSTREQRLTVLPVKAAGASAIKVISSVDDGLLKFKLLVVLDALPDNLTCENKTA